MYWIESALLGFDKDRKGRGKEGYDGLVLAFLAVVKSSSIWGLLRPRSPLLQVTVKSPMG